MRIQNKRSYERGVRSQLDTAFAFVQNAKARFDAGDEAAKIEAWNYVTDTAAGLRNAIKIGQLTAQQTELTETKIQALVSSATCLGQSDDPVPDAAGGRTAGVQELLLRRYR